MSRRNLILTVAILIAAVAAVFIVRDWVIPMFATPAATGVPTAASLRERMTQTANAATKSSSFNLDDGSDASSIQLVMYRPNGDRNLVAQGNPPYESCIEQRGITPTPTQNGVPASAATIEPTAEAAAVAESTPVTEGGFVFFRIDPEASEACYQVGEVFFDQNQFNLAVGVTKSIDGEVAVDLNNVANSQIGDIVINISEFQSDSGRRDGIIRQRWLESNQYPYATLTEAKIVGLPAEPYKEGLVLKFQIVGQLEVHGTKHETTFDATATLKENVLVITATADTKMTNFGFEPPSLPQLRANDDFRIVLNFVARPSVGEATPAS
jgi:polyisoprenoid-binding protein YceI